MDTVVLITGVLSSVAALASLGVYIASLWRSDPRLHFRFSDEQSIRTDIYGEKGYLLFGISTKHTHEVELTKVCIPVPTDGKIKFFPTDLFKAVPWKEAVAYCWTGNQIIRAKTFLLFKLPFEVLKPAEGITFRLSILATASLTQQHWGFPWSMFQLMPKSVRHVRTLTWNTKSTTGNDSLFRLGPKEAAESFGAFATEAVNLHGKIDQSFAVRICEIYDDDSHSIVERHGKFGEHFGEGHKDPTSDK